MSGATRKCAVIGAGAWGTALAGVLADAGGDVLLWCFEPEVADEVNTRHENVTYLSGHELSPRIKATTSLPEALEGADLVLSVSPAQVVRRVMADAAAHIPEGAPIVSASKGIEIGTGKLMHEVLTETLGERFAASLAALSGPSFAAEVAAKAPTAVSIAAADHAVAARAQEAFTTPYFRTYVLDDMVGVELGGALKNIIAIAAGIVEGLGFGHNSRAALITRGLAEIGRMGAKMGADPLTFLGLSGLGDLVLTCTGDLSRNRTVGYRLGQGEKLGEILASMKAVAEGVKTCQAVHELAQRLGVEMPITEQVWQVLNLDKDPREALTDLMSRPSKREFYELESGK